MVAQVVKLVDTPFLSGKDASLAGSNPVLGTIVLDSIPLFHV